MGIYDRPYYHGEGGGVQLRFPTSGVMQLILANVVIYLADWMAQGRLSSALGLSADVIVRPWLLWQLVTYGFMHDPRGVGHIVYNMLGLFFFGRVVEGLYGRRTFLAFYFSAMMLSGLVWAIISAITHSGGPLIGASGAITAVVLLFVFHFPRATVYLNFFIPVPAWLLGILFVAGDLFNFLGGQDQLGNGPRVAYDVHLVGAAYAWIYYKTRWDLSRLWPAGGLRWPQLFSRRPNLRVHRPDRADDDLAKKADLVLAKLHREGEASLTARERRILEEYSRRVRQHRR